ncbi:MAG: 2-phospho-L-lactate transferase CofD family protein [Candidatus Parvarchaeota archaeon]|jgi:uncharacterized cofD-like protein|nr:2-phospho-L-lactate transferase CofD family protein [Candidatus Parvarchaeota archaeon]
MSGNSSGSVKKVCVIGGAGVKNTASALKKIKGLDIKVIVSTFDSGGHTGFLRKQLGIYAIGDIRDNLIAAAGDKETSKAFSTRSRMCGSNQSIGNLILVGLMNERKSHYLEAAHDLLKIPSNIRILPIVDDINYTGDLVINTNKGKLIGEHNLDVQSGIRVNGISLSEPVDISSDAKKAIEGADFIIFGPGDIFSSILPNTLVNGFKSALRASNAKKILILNTMNKVNETYGYKASDFLNVFKENGITIDTVVVNKGRAGKSVSRSNYGKEHGFVVNDLFGDNVFSYDLINKRHPEQHDPDKLSLALNDILRM